MIQPSLSNARRVVIKIGSLLITDTQTGSPRTAWLNSIATDIANLHANGTEVIIVTSGAVAFGRAMLNLPPVQLRLSEKQAAAACGQIRLVEAWALALSTHNITVAQMLLTAADTENRRRYLNARRTIDSLIDYKVIPVINENDSVTTEEIRYGDNDRLAARVAAMASADLLILLSDIDGLYTADPRINSDAQFIPMVEEITPAIEAMAGGARGPLSSGGMRTKIIAAQMAVSSGCHMVIAHGHELHPLQRIMQGERSTWFLAKQTPLNARKHWIAHSVQVTGAIVIDDGAANAIVKGNSLLPVGVRKIEGHFDRGDTVRIKSLDGRELGKGLAAYSSDESARLCGVQSDKIESILGYQGRSEMIHYDDMALEL
jgi:glutamate 5-kinase